MAPAERGRVLTASAVSCGRGPGAGAPTRYCYARDEQGWSASVDRRMFLGATGALAAMGVPMAANATPKEPVKLARAYPYLDAFLKLPAPRRNRFHLAYYLMQGGKPAAGCPPGIGDAP